VECVLEEVIQNIRNLASRVLATTSGTVEIKNLKGAVTVIRDKWGVPHIYADHIGDLFFAQGYIHAQDRLWQMELFRRLASGTLSETLGEATLDLDVYMRTIGLKRAAKAEAEHFLETADEQTRAIVKSYTDGVNEYIESHRDSLPLEFSILSIQPLNWSIIDTMLIGKYMGWMLGGNWDSELLRVDLNKKLGEKMARELLPFCPTETSTIIPSDGHYQELASSLLSKLRKVEQVTKPDKSGLGSNNWVVDGHKSVTGKPLLANDPHLGIQMPSIWYEIHLIGPRINVIGASLAGTPGVIIGHNEHIAWGMTNVGPDVQDLYVEKINPENPHQYLYKEKWEDMQVVKEEFVVKGKETPIVRQVCITRHGPIVDFWVLEMQTPVMKRELKEAFALKWSGYQPSQIFQAVIKLDRARNWEEFREALKLWGPPSQNFVYADIDGNIGYQMAHGLVPIRSKGQGLVPVPGWTGEYEWEGFIPFEELPSALNPPTHFIVTANQKIVSDDYPHFISHEWAPAYRARRITQLLTASERLSIEDFMRIQADVLSLHAQELLPHLVNLQPQNERQKEALNCLKDWDLQLSGSSVAALIFEVWYDKLLQNILKEKLGNDLLKHYLQNGFHILAIRQILQYPTAFWFGEGLGSNLEKRDSIVQLSLEQALEEISSKLGADVSQWRWGRFHTATFAHILGARQPLDKFLNFGPIETGGDGNTVNQGGFNRNIGFNQLGVPSYRQIVDLGDFSKSVSMHTTGQSGQPSSKHYSDFVELWRKTKYHPMLFKREDIEKEEESRLILTPC
jgi:penicillin amidase